LVLLAAQADLKPAESLPDKAAKGRFVYRELTAVAAATQPPVIGELRTRGLDYKPFWIANMIWVKGGRAAVESLAQRMDVARICANPRVRIKEPPRPVFAAGAGQPAAPAAIEWNISKVRAPDVWESGFRGQGVVVGGQDTGYDWDHPSLINQYRGWNGSSANHNYNWHDAIHGAGGDLVEPYDDNGHGTHTMGTILGNDLAPTDGQWPAGAANAIGMAPAAQWMCCRNMKNGDGTPATYSECYQWFVAPTDLQNQNPRPDLAPDVISNSWSCPPSEGCTDVNVLLAVVQNVRAAGILTVHSGGNDGPACATADGPAGIYAESFTVGATDSSDTIASYSSRGPVTVDGSQRRKPDVSAPGSSIRSCLPGSSYGAKSGTSMAAPHVAGLAALLLSALPTLSGNVSALEQSIARSAIPKKTGQGCGGDSADAVPNHVYGWGRVDAWAALQRIIGKDDLGGTWDGQGVYFRSSDTGTWTPLASPADMIAGGDLGGDGKADLIGIWPGQAGVWMRDSSDGAWTHIGSSARHIDAGDMNGDGRDDFLGTWDGQGVFFKDSVGGTWVQISTQADLLAAGDLDGDGKDDLIGIWPAQNGVWVKSSLTGDWSNLGSSPRDLATGDMNADGRVDLVGTWDGQGVFYRDSITGAWVQMATPADLIAAGDLDGDGKDDLIGIWSGQAGVWVKYSQSLNWSFIGSSARDIAAGKFSGGSGWAGKAGALALPLPMGGNPEIPGRSGYRDLSADGPGGSRFVCAPEPKLEPRTDRRTDGARRIPGPGEPGFRSTRQKNLVPGFPRGK
jgi:subtilisin family serine protease